MRFSLATLVVLPLLFPQAGRAQAIDHSAPVTPDEMRDAQTWYDARLGALSARTVAAQVPAVRCQRQGWGQFQTARSVNKLPLTLNGTPHATGFGSHAPAVVDVTLPDGATRFTGVCGVDDTADARAARHAVVFTIEADDHEVFRSPPQTADMPPAAFALDLHGVRRLTLSTVSPGGDYTYTPIDYCDLELTATDGTKISLGRPPTDERARGVNFGFTYDAKPSSALLPTWPMTSDPLPTPPDRTGRRLTWTDPATGLECSVDLIRYTHYPVVEWTCHFRNTGKADTPLLGDVHATDLAVAAPDAAVLHYNTGDYESDDGYAPHTAAVAAGTALHFAPDDGRPSSRAWPYFNLEEPAATRGQIVAVAWPGQWAADFIGNDDSNGGVRVTAGQELLRVRLRPGERIRTPMSVVMLYRGDATRSQNLWRRWMLDCNTPRPHGDLPPHIFSSTLGLHQSETTETDGIRLFAAHHAPLTHWWMDAGWYPCPPGQWWTVGTWDPDPQRFPHGIKPVSDLAHAQNMGLILWIEPERVHINSWLDTHHPEWLLKCEPKPDERLLDLGNPQAWQWIVEKVDGILTREGVDLYRQDFNTTPLPFWRAHDTADRQGMTEMRHVEGYLAFWDELHRRHPDLLIDTCASGGRRLDLETLRRSVPLWRSDDSENPEVNQCLTYGLAAWLPYYGSGVGCDSSYVVRSQMHPFLSLGLPHTPGRPMDWDLFRRETDHWLAINDDLLGDYYPLLPYRLDRDSWMAWQFDRPDLGRGVVQAFRRPDSAYAAAVFKLHGLDPDAHYAVTDLDATGPAKTMLGRDLMTNGLSVRLDAQPAAALVIYEKQK